MISRPTKTTKKNRLCISISFNFHSFSIFLLCVFRIFNINALKDKMDGFLFGMFLPEPKRTLLHATPLDFQGREHRHTEAVSQTNISFLRPKAAKKRCKPINSEQCMRFRPIVLLNLIFFKRCS